MKLKVKLKKHNLKEWGFDISCSCEQKEEKKKKKQHNINQKYNKNNAFCSKNNTHQHMCEVIEVYYYHQIYTMTF